MEIITNISNWIYNAKALCDPLIAGIIVFICILIITLIMIISMTKIKKHSVAVVFSTIFGCLLMLPTITAFNIIIDKSATSAIKKQKLSEIKQIKDELELTKKITELAEQKKLNEQQKLINIKQNIKLKNLENETERLRNSQLTLQGYTDKTEISLIEANLSKTEFYKKMFRDFNIKDAKKILGMIKWGNKKIDYEEGLVILNYDIIANFGFNLNEMKLLDSEDVPNTLLISGLNPKYLGRKKFDVTEEFSELREVNIDPYKYGEFIKANENISEQDLLKKLKIHSSVKVLNDIDAMQKMDEYSKQCENETKNRLEKGLESQFLNSSLNKLSQDFIKLILSPLGKKIVFIDVEKKGALSLKEYLDIKVKNLEAEKETIKNNFDTVVEELDKELKKEVQSNM